MIHTPLVPIKAISTLVWQILGECATGVVFYRSVSRSIHFYRESANIRPRRRRHSRAVTDCNSGGDIEPYQARYDVRGLAALMRIL